MFWREEREMDTTSPVGLERFTVTATPIQCPRRLTGLRSPSGGNPEDGKVSLG